MSKDFILLILFTLIHSSVVLATESIDCGNNEYWIQLHYNYSEDDYGGFTLHKNKEIINTSMFTHTNITSNFKNQTIYFSSTSEHGEIKNIQLRVKGSKGHLTIDTITFKVDCDWSAYE